MLLQRTLERIAADGPVPFEEFMAACLYDPQHGFFATGPLRSTKGGDFLTSPEVSPWFGRTLARWVAATHRRLDPPGRTLVEAGAGSGSLLRALLDGLPPGTVDVVWAVEASPAARRTLATLPEPTSVVSDLTEVPPRLRGTIVANELLDNLPVALAVRSGSGWEERWVGEDGGELFLVAAPPRPEVADWADRFGGRVPPGGVVEVQLEATAWVATAVGHLEAGALLVVDYGGTTEELEPRRTRGTLRTYRSHHLGPDPLTAPGETDVTVDVNFTAMAAAAATAGASVEVLRQDDFLTAWGLGEEIRRMRRDELRLAKQGAGMERLKVRSERNDAETLLHPRGLGDFRVLVAHVGASR